jgi:hypothetical protein
VPAVVAGSGPAEIILNVTLPQGYKVNEDASSSLFLSEEGGVAAFPDGESTDLTGTHFPVSVPINLTSGTGTVVADLALVWCREDAEGLCFFERLRYQVPVEVTPDGPPGVIELPLVLEEPEL